MALAIQERLKDLRLSDGMIELLKSVRMDNALIVKQHNPDISDPQTSSLVFICKQKIQVR